jgi:hypothetical protein
MEQDKWNYSIFSHLMEQDKWNYSIFSHLMEQDKWNYEYSIFSRLMESESEGSPSAADIGSWVGPSVSCL